jgi:ferredoxin-type protein NapH
MRYSLKHATLGLKRGAAQFVALLALHSSWGPEVKWFCNPVLTCHSCALYWFACPVGVLVHFSGYRLFPFLLVGMIALLGILLGRLLCGWVCPFGFLQDVLYRIRTRKVRLPRWTNAIKYGVLLGLVIALPWWLGEQTTWSFCRLFCPASAIEVTLPRLLADGRAALHAAAAFKLSVLAIVLAACVVSSRAFCRVLCPIGAMLAPFNLFSLWKVRAPAGDCVSCRICDKACPTDDPPSRRLSRRVEPSRSLDCIGCGECSQACPHGTVPGRNAP